MRDLHLNGKEAQYAVRYLRRMAGRREAWPPPSLVADKGRRRNIERFMDDLAVDAAKVAEGSKS